MLVQSSSAAVEFRSGFETMQPSFESSVFESLSDVEAQRQFKAWCESMPNSYEEALHFMHHSPTGLHNAIALTDKFHHITDVNHSWEVLCGYHPEEVKGRTFRFMQGALTDAQVLCRVNRSLQRGEAVQVLLVNYTHDGREFHNHLQIKPLYSDSDSREVTHFLGELRDIAATPC